MKFTKKHFDHFKARCEHWLDYYGVYDYDVEFGQEELPDDDIAQCRYFYPGKDLYIVLGTEWPPGSEPPKDIYACLNKIAHHETAEGILSKFRDLVHPDKHLVVDEWIHGVIHRLWNAAKRQDASQSSFF